MPISPETPRYRTLQEAFFAPYLVPPGAIINWDGPPGPHLEPINAAAHAKMEEYYNEVYTYKVKDPDGGEDLVRSHQPRKDLRPAAPGETIGQNFTLEVLANPVVRREGELTLSTLGLKRDTDQRPGPLVVAPVPDEFKEAAPEAASVETESGSSLALVTAPPPLPVEKGGTVASTRRGG